MTVLQHNFPKYRHLLVRTPTQRYPVRVLRETPMTFETSDGTFLKAQRHKMFARTTTFEGPFTAEGDME